MSSVQPSRTRRRDIWFHIWRRRLVFSILFLSLQVLHNLTSILVDVEPEPTIQCFKYRNWYFQHCIGSLESTTGNFTCPNPPRTKSDPQRKLSCYETSQWKRQCSSFAKLKRTDLEETVLNAPQITIPLSHTSSRLFFVTQQSCNCTSESFWGARLIGALLGAQGLHCYSSRVGTPSVLMALHWNWNTYFLVIC